MPRQQSSRAGDQPPVFPETTPPKLQATSTDYGQFAFQTAMELQKAVGQLQEAVGTLKEQGKQHSEKLDKISLRIYAASAVIVVLGTIIGFLLNKGVDLLIQLTNHH